MKICSKCKKEKGINGFYKDKNRKDGLYPICKICKNSDEALYRETHKEQKAVRMAIYRDRNKKEITVKNAVYRAENERALSDQKANYYIKNKEIILARQNEYYVENKEVIDKRNAAWKKDNPGKANAIAAQRRAVKLQATPKWLTGEHRAQIQAIYAEASILSEETNIPRHVDHIIPLQGEGVAGLHVPWNLQILTAIENIKKSNKI